MNLIAIIMGVLGGAFIGAQGGINAQLTKHWAKNSVLASAISFLVGALALWALSLVLFIPIPALTDKILWWHWTGGILGAYFVYSLVYLSPRLGASVVVALVLAGQILAAVVLDHFGLAGYPVRPVNTTRLIGIALLGAGVLLIRKS
ncbi:DMT family transporter [uncultured Psychrobacter sp.]|uniref:DMT family transporter n=1 Tax=uncultured Psychrobacter sp. TaxID=259303 RepID=UPI0034590C1A